MKILITGATGLVGKTLLKKAIEQGHSIHFLTTRKSQLGTHGEAYGFYWNPKDDYIDKDCFEGVDTIIHLAGATVSKRWTKKYKEEILNSRLSTTRLLIHALKDSAHTVENIVSASAIGIYPSSFDTVYREDAVIEANSFMEEVVVQWEHSVNQFSALNIKVSKLRIGLVLAKNGGLLSVLKTPIKFGVGSAFGNGKQWQSWIHIEDLTNLFLKAAEEQWQGVFNAVAPEVVSQTELIRQIAKAMKKPFFMPPIPKFLARLLLGEMSTLTLNSQNVSAKKIRDKGFEFHFLTLEKALTNLLR